MELKALPPCLSLIHIEMCIRDRANAVLLKPLADNITAVGIPARPVKKDGIPIPKEEKKLVSMDHYCKMEARVKELEEELGRLKALVEEKKPTEDR